MTHPSPMLYELLSIDLVQPRYSYEVLLCLDKAIPQCLVLPSQCIENRVLRRVSVTSAKGMRRLRSRSSVLRGCTAAPVHMRGSRLLLCQT